MSKPALLRFTDRGIYCPAGEFYIDPWRPVERALRHSRYLSTDIAAPVISHRLNNPVLETVRYGETRQIKDALVSFHPAGHIPGSAQIRIEVAGEIWVVSGDYKIENDGLTTPFEPLKCHSFIRLTLGGQKLPKPANAAFWVPTVWARRSACYAAWMPISVQSWRTAPQKPQIRSCAIRALIFPKLKKLCPIRIAKRSAVRWFWRPLRYLAALGPNVLAKRQQGL